MEVDPGFRELIDTVPVPIWCADRRGGFVYVNRTWADFTGRAAAEQLGLRWADLLHPDDLPQLGPAMEAPMQAGAPFRLALRLRRHDGAWRHVLCSAVPRPDGSGGWAGFVGSCLDLTDAQEAERQRQRDTDDKAAVMQELHHRVKNNAQVFASLLSVQASRATDPAVRAALRSASARASTMAYAQQQIWDAGSSGRFDLVALVRRLVRAEPVRDVLVDIDAPSTLFVPLATAVPLGLIVHELLSNALAHGFPDGRAGTVRVRLGRNGDGQLVMTVADDGVGVADPAALEAGRSAGLTIVRSLTRQLGATIAIQTGAEPETGPGPGTEVTLVAPCPTPG